MIQYIQPCLETLRKHVFDVHEEYRSFIATVHDWLAHLTNQSSLWYEFDSSLTNVLIDQIEPLYRTWVNEVIHRNDDAISLLYRHYLLRRAVSKDIMFDRHNDALYILMSSMIVKRPSFAPLTMSLWCEPIVRDNSFVNQFRTKHLYTNLVLQDLANTFVVLDRPDPLYHATLSSFSLLYGLSLILVVMIFDYDIHPSYGMATIINALSNALLQSQGAISDAH